MKRICICTTVSLTMKIFVVETAKYLYEKCGYDITLICNEDKSFEDSLPEYIHFIPVHMARGIDFSALSSIKQFVRIFKAQKFDMVQYSTPNAACYASIAARIVGVPIRLYHQWGIRYVGMSGISRRIFRVIEKMVCANSTDIRAQSPLNMKFSICEGLYRANKASVIGYGGTIGVDTFEYDIGKKERWKNEIRSQMGVDDNSFVFGFSGRISVDKGCRELLSAFRKLIEQGKNAKLLIVGPVDDECGVDKALITWAKENPNVLFTGMVERQNMKKYYSAMDVLVHPTYREGFGMVLQEAGALGIPAITTNIPGASEVFIHEISGMHVPVKNIEGLASAMSLFLEKRDLAKIMGEKAYEWTKERYDRSIMLENQRADYEKLIDMG